MKTVSFFRLMLLLPLAVPLLLLPFGFQAMVALAMLAATFGGVQYLVFAALFLFLSKKFDNQKLKKVVLSAPVLFMPFQLMGVVIGYFFVHESTTWASADMLGWFMIFSVYTVVIGYFYVALAWLLYWIFTKLNVVRD